MNMQALSFEVLCSLKAGGFSAYICSLCTASILLKMYSGYVPFSVTKSGQKVHRIFTKSS